MQLECELTLQAYAALSFEMEELLFLCSVLHWASRQGTRKYEDCVTKRSELTCSLPVNLFFPVLHLHLKKSHYERIQGVISLTPK